MTEKGGLSAGHRPLPSFASREGESLRRLVKSYEDHIALIDRAETAWSEEWLVWADRRAIGNFPKDMELVARWMLHEVIRGNAEIVRRLRIVLLSLPEPERRKPTMVDALARGAFLLGLVEDGTARLGELLRVAEYDSRPAQAAQLRALVAAGRSDEAVALARGLIGSASRDLSRAAAEALVAGALHAELCAAVEAKGGIEAIEEEEDAYLYLSALEATGQFAQCLASGIGFLDRHPGSVMVAQLLRHIAIRLDAVERIEPSLMRCADALAGQPAALELRGLIALDRDEYRKARSILRLFEDPTEETALRFALSLATTEPGTPRPAVRRCYRAYRRSGPRHAGPEMQYGSYLLNAARSRSDLREALAVVSAGLPHGGSNPYFHRLYLSLLIANGRHDAARAHLDGLSDGMRQSRLIREVVMYFRQVGGDHDRVRRDWAEHVAPGSYRALSAVTGPALRAEGVSAPAMTTEEAVTVFAVVFNGIDYVAPFLAHYRALGVRRFVIVDNGSTDGTREALADAEDVVLYDQPGSFRASAHGVAWINPLLHEHAAERWALFVDIDEHLVFPGLSAGRTVNDLVRYAEGIGAGCFASFMLDMFATPASARLGIAGHRYFDGTYVAFDGVLPPYRVVQGGVRGRLTGRQFLITKSPLVRVEPGLMFLENNHLHTHLPPAPVTTALLHYKFLGDSRGRFTEAVERGEHFLGGRLYRDMLARMTGDGIRRGLWARRYRDDLQLVRMGLLRTTEEWDRQA